jgi:hypothetical protein
MNQIKKQDLKLGTHFEKVVLNFLNLQPENKDNQFVAFKNKYEPMDFINNNIIAELKTRKNHLNKYDTTMCGYNKIEEIENNPREGYKYIFYFLFIDGLYRWDYNKDEFYIDKGGRCDRGCEEIKDYSYINIRYLKLVDKDLSSLKW